MKDGRRIQQVKFGAWRVSAAALSIIIGVVLTSAVLVLPSIASQDKKEDYEANKQLLIAAQENNIRKMELALKSGADINAKTESGQTVLHFVQDEQLAKLLIEKGANVNLKEYDFEMTPIYFHDVAIVKILYKAGADINIKAKRGITPLMWYSYNNYLDGVRFLLANGAHINMVNDEDSTALDIAARFEYTELVEYLRSVGAKTAAELRQ